MGFILFYAPFALFQKVIFYFLAGRWTDYVVHEVCFRIQIEHLLDGKLFRMPGFYVSFTSSLLLTMLLWFVLFGLLTKGGRGFCNFLCPVGAGQSLVYWCSRHLPFVYGFQVDEGKCVGCGYCRKKCPMDAIQMVNSKAKYSAGQCIQCGECKAACPVQAIQFKKTGDRS